MLQARLQHWLIEAGLHFGRDVPFHEDATRMTIGAARWILAIVHNLVIGLIKRAGHNDTAKGRRYYDRHLDEASALLLTANCHS